MMIGAVPVAPVQRKTSFSHLGADHVGAPSDIEACSCTQRPQIAELHTAHAPAWNRRMQLSRVPFLQRRLRHDCIVFTHAERTRRPCALSWHTCPLSRAICALGRCFPDT